MNDGKDDDGDGVGNVAVDDNEDRNKNNDDDTVITKLILEIIMVTMTCEGA